MRSDLTLMPLANGSNRYLLTTSVAKVTRMLHRPNTHVQDTMNEAFKWLGCFKPGAAEATITWKDSSGRPPAPCHDPAFDHTQPPPYETRSANTETSFAPVSPNPIQSTTLWASCCFATLAWYLVECR